MNFCPSVVPQSRTWGGERFCNSALAEYQNRKIFISLIEKRKETDPLGNIITYSYDSKGNLTSKTDANGNTITYAYDSLNRLTQKKYPDNTIEAFNYDSKGNIIYAGNQHIAYNFNYDAKGRLLAVTDSNGRTIQYEYDAIGNRTKMITPEGKL